MRKTIILALAVGGVLAGGVGIWAPGVSAQSAPPAPPPPQAGDAMRGPMDGGMRGPMEGGMHGPMDRRAEMMRHGDLMRRMRQFALIYPARDKALSGADVQKIAEAFLLINGNHTWKITEARRHRHRAFFDGPSHRAARTHLLILVDEVVVTPTAWWRGGSRAMTAAWFPLPPAPRSPVCACLILTLPR